ncbi:MAG: hypothetical protein ABI823_04130 [Bryobacteraceae bacterium]
MTSTGALLRACRGPIVLITLGTLTAIDTFGQYSLTRTWPIILIVFGLLKLAEKAAETRGGNEPYPPSSAAYAGAPQTYESPAPGAYSSSASYVPPSQPLPHVDTPPVVEHEHPRQTEDQ